MSLAPPGTCPWHPWHLDRTRFAEMCWNWRRSLGIMRFLALNLSTAREVARRPDAARDSRRREGRSSMPAPHADDPLRTTDHAPAPEPEAPPETLTTAAPPDREEGA